MKNFKSNNIGKKLWGVLGKQQTYYYQPGLAQQGKEKTPLNANAFVAWDYKKSRYRRVDLVPRQLENDGQQAGVVPQETSTPDVTPTPTPSITPSSSPSLPTPALWYDSTNLGSIDYISSGGTDYVSTWRSIGTYQKALSGTTTDTMPIWSGSSRFPDTPLIVRFSKNTNSALRDWLSQRFDGVSIPQSGFTVFEVIANPVGGNYVFGGTAQFQFPIQLFSANTAGGFGSPTGYVQAFNIGGASNGITVVNVISGITTANNFSGWSGIALNEKYLYTQSIAYNNQSSPWQLNETGGTLTTLVTGNTNADISGISIGLPITSAGTANTAFNSGAEIGEIMIYNRVLSAGEITQVQNYLKNKWKYSEWAVIPPSPTPTTTPTMTPTNTTTPTMTPTPSSTRPLPLSFIVASGATAVDACSELTTGTTFTVYAQDLGNCGGCTSAGLNCWACLSTGQQVFLDSSFTQIVPDGYYANDMNGAGNNARWNIIGGYPQGGGFSGC